MLSVAPSMIISSTGGYDAFPVAAWNGREVLAMWRAAKPYGHAADPDATTRASRLQVTPEAVTAGPVWTALDSTEPLTEVSPAGLDWDEKNRQWVMLAFVRRLKASNPKEVESYGASLLTSTDAQSWRVVAAQLPTPGMRWFFASDLKTDAGMIVVSGYGGFEGENFTVPVTMCSVDGGVTWTAAVRPAQLPTSMKKGREPQLLRLPTGWLMTIRGDDDGSVHVATSPDARSWTWRGVAVRNVSGSPEIGLAPSGEIVMLLRQKPTVDNTHGGWAWATSLDGVHWDLRVQWPDDLYMMYGALVTTPSSLVCVYASEDDPSAMWRSSSIYVTQFATPQPAPTSPAAGKASTPTPILSAAAATPAPPRWRYLAYALRGDGTQELLSSDLDLDDVSFDVVLSGVPALSAAITSESAYLKRSGEPVLKPWAAAIYVEHDQQIRGGFIVTEVTESGPKLSITATGFTGFAAGTPYGSEKSFVQTDALDVLRHIWQHIQSQPGADLGLVLDDTKSGVLLGRQSVDQLPLYAEGSRLAALPPEGTLWRYQRTKTPAKPAVTVKKTDPKTKKVTVTTTPAKPAVVETLYGESRRAVPKPIPAGAEVILRDRKTTVVGWLEGPEDGFPQDRYDVVGLASKQAPKQDTEGEQLQPFTLQWFADSDLQQKIDAVFAEGNFDWWEEHAWAGDGTAHRMRFAVPLAGRVREDLRFVVGENVLADPDLQQRSDDYASEVVVLGAGEGRAMVKGTWKMTAPPRVRRVKTITDKSITSATVANLRAEREGLAANGGQNITTLAVRDHPNAPLGAWSLGDTILVQGSGQGWAGEWAVKVRVLSYTVQPDADTATLTVARAERARL